MRLAIADPPYLGRAARNYGRGSDLQGFGQGDKTKHSGSPRRTSVHDEAHAWDDPETHRRLVDLLVRDYDGWAVAMAPDNLRHYLQWVPADTRIAVWVRPRSVPTGSRITPSWEPVLVHVPRGRRDRSTGQVLTDVFTAPPPQTFVGAKPRPWTRWVLDLLGYDPDADDVDDLFPGSGAVSSEIAQRVLVWTTRLDAQKIAGHIGDHGGMDTHGAARRGDPLIVGKNIEVVDLRRPR